MTVERDTPAFTPDYAAQLYLAAYNWQRTAAFADRGVPEAARDLEHAHRRFFDLLRSWFNIDDELRLRELIGTAIEAPPQ